MKVCSKCKVEKDESEFGKNIDNKDKLQYRCKTCNKEYSKSEKWKIYKSEYNKKHPKSEKRKEKLLEYHRKYLKSEKGKNNAKNSKSHIKRCLGLIEMSVKIIPQELIELKRIQLKIKRELKNGVQNENIGNKNMDRSHE